MLATDKQILYLCALANRVEKIKVINSKINAIKNLPEYIDWHQERHMGVTTLDASIRIKAYKNLSLTATLFFHCAKWHKYNRN